MILLAAETTEDRSDRMLMGRLALMSVGLIVLLSALPSVLPLEGTLAVLAAYVAYLVWRVLPR